METPKNSPPNLLIERGEPVLFKPPPLSQASSFYIKGPWFDFFSYSNLKFFLENFGGGGMRGIIFTVRLFKRFIFISAGQKPRGPFWESPEGGGVFYPPLTIIFCCHFCAGKKTPPPSPQSKFKNPLKILGGP